MEATAVHQIQSFSRTPHHSMVHPSLTPGQELPGQFAPHFYSTQHETERLEPRQDTGTSETKENGADVPNIEILISNVVCTFSVRCHLNLKRIGMEAVNVEYKRESGKVLMKLRKPYCTATIWSSGKITLTGNSSEADAKKSARRIARILQKLGFRVHFHQFQIVNVLGTCRLPFAIRIDQFSNQYPKEASYEPEIHPAATYKIKSPKATLKVFSTGSITVTAPSVENIDHAINHIYPLVEPYKRDRVEVPPEDKPPKVTAKKTKMPAKQEVLIIGGQSNDYDSEEDVLDDDSEEEEMLDDNDEEEWESELSDDDL